MTTNQESVGREWPWTIGGAALALAYGIALTTTEWGSRLNDSLFRYVVIPGAIFVYLGLVGLGIYVAIVVFKGDEGNSPLHWLKGAGRAGFAFFIGLPLISLACLVGIALIFLPSAIVGWTFGETAATVSVGITIGIIIGRALWAE